MESESESQIYLKQILICSSDGIFNIEVFSLIGWQISALMPFDIRHFELLCLAEA